MTAPRFTVLYRVTPDDDRSIEAHAKDICIEQTVEIPADAVPAGHWEKGIVGIIEKITERPGTPTDYDVLISYRVDITNNEIPGLLNVLFGNISIRRGIKIVDISFTPDQLKAFGGPRYGIEGIRKALNVHGRPLATTAIKPLGLSSPELAAMCGGYARGGLDVIKDDHGLIDQHFHPFRERIARIAEAIREGNAKSGNVTHYYPMLAGRFDQVEAQAAFAKEQGCFGVLVPPFLIGPDTGFYLARKYDLAVMTHPTFSGTHFHDPRHGMTPAVLLGKLFRLFGADISVFPNFGGRFTFSREECVELADDLRKPWGGLNGAFPSPAGGMTIEKIGTMIDAFGVDTALLIGGALLRYSPDQEVSARAFVTGLDNAMKERKP
ncbi:MAG: ribulose 1,5-bisphosphate carboxylase [Proteobacteria bacterium]|nr:ribulose 1,5-bisphosphate carboxylase [Pseudomonadota bacterium]